LSQPLGLFGGTFDPVHYGHLRLAEEAINHLGLAGVRWIPAGQPPHRGTPQVTAQQRLEMVLRSTAKIPDFQWMRARSRLLRQATRSIRWKDCVENWGRTIARSSGRR
jgi:cytidyltransferase-like protein